MGGSANQKVSNGLVEMRAHSYSHGVFEYRPLVVIDTANDAI